MANTDYLKNFLTDVANAIREKKGSAGLINPQDFSNEIRNLVGLPSVDKIYILFIIHPPAKK